jgi:tetratricopeptide (TPR) repeat protein
MPARHSAPTDPSDAFGHNPCPQKAEKDVSWSRAAFSLTKADSSDKRRMPMSWIPPVASVASILILLVQGISCLTRPRAAIYVYRFGWLSISVAAFGIVLSLALWLGTLIISPELGLGLVQGPLAWHGMAFLLVSLPVCAGLGLHVSRLAARPKQSDKILWSIGLGGMFGGLAVYRLQCLNAADLEQFRVYAYDLWWPPMLMWVGVCLVEIVLMIFRSHRWPARLWLITAVFAGLAHMALAQPRLADPWSADLWRATLWILLPLNMALVSWLLCRRLSQRLTWFGHVSSRFLVLVPGSIAILNGLYWIGRAQLEMAVWPWPFILGWYGAMIPAMTSLFSLVWLLWPAIVGHVARRSLYRAWLVRLRHWHRGSNINLRQRVLFRAVVVLSASLAGFMYFVNMNRILALTGFMVAWILLGEALARGPLGTVRRLWLRRRLWVTVRQGAGAASQQLSIWLKYLMTLGFMPTALGKIAVYILMITVFIELPNANHTLIFPLKTPSLPGRTEFGTSAQERSDLGQVIAERVANTLGRLQRDLRKELILSLQSDEEAGDGKESFTLASVGDGNVEIKLGSSMVPLGGLEVPLGALMAPIQGLVRAALGVLVIHGSVQVDEHGFSLLAGSSAGDTWRVRFPPGETSDHFTAIPAEGVASLADDLALKILGTDPTLAPALTRSRQAFEPFQNALQQWRHFEARRDYAALTKAIEQFQEAIRADAGFAFAHYRLGLALQRDGQPEAAIRAFRASLTADPNFVPAYTALAATLFDYERYTHAFAAALPVSPLRGEQAYMAGIDEAYHLWQQLITSSTKPVTAPNRAAAYYGLCRYALKQARTGPRKEANSRSPDHPPTHEMNGRSSLPDTDSPLDHYLAYYYCTQAKALYARLTGTERSISEVTRAEAYVMQTLGITLEGLGLATAEGLLVQEPQWNCWRRALRPNSYARESLRYYLRALSLLPDDRRIHCYAARAASVLDNNQLMTHLQHDAAAHVNLAASHRRIANQCSLIESPTGKLFTHFHKSPTRDSQRKPCLSQEPTQYLPTSVYHYRQAIDEYAEAIKLNETNFDAVIGYAATFWEWWVDWQPALQLPGPGIGEAHDAETYARHAVLLASAHSDAATQSVARLILGKVLLARGRPDEAIAEFEPAFALFTKAVGVTSVHPVIDEMRRSLLYAHRCLVDGSQRNGSQGNAQSSRQQLLALEQVRHRIEPQRVTLPFGRHPITLDSIREELICTHEFVAESRADYAALMGERGS